MDPGELQLLTRILGLESQQVVDASVDENEKRLDLFMAPPQAPFVCPHCGREHANAHDRRERAVRDKPWADMETFLHFTLVRIRCCQGQAPIELPPAPFVKKNSVIPKGSAR